MSAGCLAQTTVTTSGGNANSIPKFSGASTIVSSSITQDATGKVGIGNSSPQATLDVAGQIQSTISDANIGGAFVVANPAKTTAGTASRWILYNMSGVYGNSLQFWAYDNIGCSGTGLCTSRLILMDNGNVGIGTMPGYRLQVAGEVASMGTGSGFRTASSNGDDVNGAPWYGIGQSNVALISGQPYTATQMAGCYGLIFQTANLQMVLRGDTGNVGIGTSNPGAKLDVNGSVKLSGSGASLTYPDGTSQSTAWTGALCGGDYAESVDVSGDRTHYEPGDVLVLDSENPGKVLKSVEPYSTVVSGIYSTKPGVVGRRQVAAKTDSEVPMAIVGIVPTKVSAENGAIHVGDLLVSSSLPGYAMKGTDRTRMLVTQPPKVEPLE